MTLDTRITDFATLVALVLVLLTLFTAQRATRLNELRGDVNSGSREAFWEIVFDVVLTIATVLLFLVGLPLVIEAAEAFRFAGHWSSLRGGLVVTWALLLPLIVWEVVLILGSWALHDKRKKREALTKGAGSTNPPAAPTGRSD